MESLVLSGKYPNMDRRSDANPVQSHAQPGFFDCADSLVLPPAVLYASIALRVWKIHLDKVAGKSQRIGHGFKS